MRSDFVVYLQVHLMIIKRLCLFVIVINATVWSPYSSAVTVINIGLLESRPWAYRTEQGKQEGIFIELFKEVENSFGGEVTIKADLLPLARVLHNMNRQLDIAVMSSSPDREKIMDPLVPLYKTPFVLLSLKGSGIQNLNDLQGKQVAMLIGGSGCPCLDGEISYQKVKLNTHTQGINMLLTHRLDAVAGPAIRLYGNVEELNVKEKLAPPIPYEWRTVWVWSSKGASQTDKITLFKEHLLRVLATGKLEELVSKYLYPAQEKYLYGLSKENETRVSK